MTDSPLTKELIADPTLWRLILRIDRRRLSALLIGPESAERSVLFHQEELPDETVKSLENAVYDNPLLLGDFAATDVIFSTAELFLAPSGSAELIEPMADAMLPDVGAPRKILADDFGAGIAAYAVEADVVNFVSRTFACARFHHSLAISALYLAHRNSSASDSAHFYALCDGEAETSMVGFDAVGHLNYLNCCRPAVAADSAYYILAAGAAAPGPVSVGGAPELRNAVCDALRCARPEAKVLPLTLPEDLLHLRRLAPGATFDMLFITQL